MLKGNLTQPFTFIEEPPMHFKSVIGIGTNGGISFNFNLNSEYTVFTKFSTGRIPIAFRFHLDSADTDLAFSLPSYRYMELQNTYNKIEIGASKNLFLKKRNFRVFGSFSYYYFTIFVPETNISMLSNNFTSVNVFQLKINTSRLMSAYQISTGIDWILHLKKRNAILFGLDLTLSTHNKKTLSGTYEFTNSGAQNSSGNIFLRNNYIGLRTGFLFDFKKRVELKYTN